MLISNQLRKDLEGFLEELYKTRQLSTELKEEDLVTKVSPKIDEFLSFYNSSLYNQERIQQLGNSLRKNIHDYAKANEELQEHILIRNSARSFVDILQGSIYGLLGKVLFGEMYIAGIMFIVGYILAAAKETPPSKEYKELEIKRKQKMEEILS